MRHRTTRTLPIWTNCSWTIYTTLGRFPALLNFPIPKTSKVRKPSNEVRSFSRKKEVGRIEGRMRLTPGRIIIANNESQLACYRPLHQPSKTRKDRRRASRPITVAYRISSQGYIFECSTMVAPLPPSSPQAISAASDL